MTITLATTEDELQAVRQLFAETFGNIAPDAVPFTREGHEGYDVLVAQALDPDGQLQGAAMTCRASIAVSSLMMGDPLKYGDVIDKCRELDLIAVDPGLRGSGVGASLISFLEGRLAASGVEVLVGNATRDLDLKRLRHFYERHGFTVGAAGAPLPRLLGKSWTMPNVEKPGFYFYKMLRTDQRPQVNESAGRPIPPNPAKARTPKKPKRKSRRK